MKDESIVSSDIPELDEDCWDRTEGACAVPAGLEILAVLARAHSRPLPASARARVLYRRRGQVCTAIRRWRQRLEADPSQPRLVGKPGPGVLPGVAPVRGGQRPDPKLTGRANRGTRGPASGACGLPIPGWDGIGVARRAPKAGPVLPALREAMMQGWVRLEPEVRKLLWHLVEH